MAQTSLIANTARSLPIKLMDRAVLWRLGLGGVLLLALLLRLWPLLAGDPAWHPDEYSFVFFPLNFFSGDLNPHFFTYPTLHYYLLGVVYALFYFFSADFSFYEWTGYHYFWHPESLMSVARLVGVFFAVLGVWGSAVLARRLAGAGAGMVAALFLAFNVLHVRQSALAAVDIPLAFWSLGAVWAAVRLLHKDTLKDYGLAGLLLGLAVSCKYPAAALAPVIVVAHVLAGRRVLGWRIALAGISALAAFAFTSPYILLDLSLFKEHFMAQVQHVEVGRGQGGGMFHVWTSLRYGVGLLAWTATWGVIASLFYRSRREDWVLLAAVLCSYAAISWGQLAFVRYALPLMGFQAVLLGVGWSLLPAKNWRYIVLLLLLVEPVYGSLRLVQIQAAIDTRMQARTWIETHVEEGARIANFGGWAGDVRLRTIDDLWWRLRHFESAFGRKRVDGLLDFLERTRPAAPFYRYVVQEGDRARASGDWNLVAEREAAYILVHDHALAYSQVDTAFVGVLAARAERVAAWQPQGLIESAPVYDASDAYYVPIGEWEALREPGPAVELWRTDSLHERTRWTARELLALAYIQEADTQRRVGDVAMAEETLQRALDLGGGLAEILYALAEYYERAGDYENAQQVYEKIKRKMPQSWRPYKALGALYLKAGEYEAALREMEQALVMGADTPGLYNNLGVVSINMGALNRGVAYLRQAVELGPERVDIWYNLGAVLQGAGRRIEAVAALRRAVEIEPDYANAGALLRELGEL
jgi:tetratricopeptide (TPR) repeat protein/4-amino-4-deoxy-L-arabinose transferase-like glycosyltransferase